MPYGTKNYLSGNENDVERNIPFIGPRARYEVLAVSPTLLVHTMTSGNLDGNRPATSTLTYDLLDPVVTAGKALWSGLQNGGLFNFTKKAVLVDALSSGTTWKIVEETTPGTYVETRSVPSVFPFRLSPDEKLQATGASKASVVARLDIQKCI